MNVIFLDMVDSTNKFAKENLSKLDDKTLIYTSNQTAGRGRFDRKWNDNGKENIYATIVLKPSEEMQDVYSNLTQYLCVVLAKTFEEYNVEPKIKWPNDILINNKKISGILAESVLEGNKLQGLILGFGVNLNCKKEDIEKINQPATSLDLEIGMQIDKEIFLKKVLERFFLGYNSFIEDGFSLIRKDYIKRVNFLEKELTVRVFDKEIRGIAKEITSDGALKIVDTDRKEQILYMGDILWTNS